MENLDGMHRQDSRDPAFGRASVTILNHFRKDPYLVLLTARRSHAAAEQQFVLAVLSPWSIRGDGSSTS